MGNYKFDKFYYSEDGSNEHYLSEIENLSDNDYQNNYKDKMYCPWCKGPQLSLVKKEGISFLRAYPKQVHILVDDEICPYEYNTASHKMVKDYIKELRSKKKIKSVLEATMRRLFRQSFPRNTTPKDKDEKSTNPLLIEKTDTNKTSTKHIIPHYSFRSWGKNMPQDQLLIVYGKVYIELKETQATDKAGNKVHQTYIHFKDIHSKRLITSCKKPDELDISAGYYYAVVLGKCYSNTYKEQTYYNLRVNYPAAESILIREMEGLL